MNDAITIRLYRPEDRPAIRRICCDTADAGEPLENMMRDRELVADLVTRYYTDFESDYSWVAEFDQSVVGYLTAAPDTGAFKQTLQWSIAPQAVIRAFFRGTFFTRGTIAMLRALIRRHGQAIRPPFTAPTDYPAHLHIDLIKQARLQGAGEKLIATLVVKLEARRIPGVHATVRTDNPGACTFFERMDFKALSHYNEILPLKEVVKDVEVTVYGRKIP